MIIPSPLHTPHSSNSPTQSSSSSHIPSESSSSQGGSSSPSQSTVREVPLDPENIKSFDLGGYSYSETMSKEKEWVFIRG